MNLRKCPGCKNMIAVDTESCPICGCEPAKRRIRQIITWLLIVGISAWAAEHYLARNFHHARSKTGDASHWADDTQDEMKGTTTPVD